MVDSKNCTLDSVEQEEILSWKDTKWNEDCISINIHKIPLSVQWMWSEDPMDEVDLQSGVLIGPWLSVLGSSPAHLQ